LASASKKKNVAGKGKKPSKEILRSQANHADENSPAGNEPVLQPSRKHPVLFKVIAGLFVLWLAALIYLAVYVNS